MLMIPAIKIDYGLSSKVISADGYKRLETFKPSDIAVIFRGENFKILHIILANENEDARFLSLRSVQEIISRIDIPVTVTVYKFPYEKIVELLNLGCYGVCINFPQNEEIAIYKKLISAFSPIKISVRLNILNGVLYDTNWIKLPFDIEEGYKSLKELQVYRIFLSCYTNKETKEIDYNFLNTILSNIQIKSTFVGGVNTHQKLIKMTQFEKLGLDSIVIGQGLYENKFACQKLWRLNEAMLDDLGPTRRI
jgi:phosphoribosylformimino-5-aminoimidazole carboxamide ribotide isomerase